MLEALDGGLVQAGDVALGAGDVDGRGGGGLDVEVFAGCDDALDDGELFVLVLGEELEDGFDLGDGGQGGEFLGEGARVVDVLRDDGCVDGGDFVALVVPGGVHDLVEGDDGEGVGVVEMEQVVVEAEVGEADGGGDGDDDGDDDPEPGVADHVAVPGVDEVPGGVAGLGVELLAGAVAVAQNEDGGEDDEIGGDAEDHAEAGDEAELGQADEIVEAKGEEGRRGGAAAGDDGDAGVLEGDGDGLAHGFVAAEFLLVAAEDLDAEVDADAEDHGDDGDGEDVEVADGDEGEAERPEHGHDEHENGDGGAEDGAIAEEEEADDERDGDEAGLDGVLVGLGGFVGVERGLAGELEGGAGVPGLEALEVIADFLRGVAEGRVGVLLFLAGVGEDEDGLAVLEREVFVLGEELVGVGVVVGGAGAVGGLEMHLLEGLALGLGGDLVEDVDEARDEFLEFRPVFLVAQVAVVEVGVGLVEDGVEVERGLRGLLVAFLVGLLGGDFVLDLRGDFLEVVGVAGEEQAGLDGGEIDLGEDRGDVGLEGLEPHTDLIGGGAVLRDVRRLDEDDVAVIAAEILAQFVVVLHRLVLVAEQVAGVVEDVPARGDDEGAQAGQEDADYEDDTGHGADHAGDVAHDVLQDSVDKRHEEGN